MPRITLTYADEASIPAELKAFKVADKNEVSVWVGDKVAEETNPALAANRDAIKAEKDTLQQKHEREKTEWTTTNGTISGELNQLRTQIASESGNKVTPEDIALLGVVKPLNLSADDLKKRIDTDGTSAAEVEKLKRQIEVGKVAEVLKWKPDVLLDLLNNPEKSKGIAFVVENVEKDGKTIPQVFVNVTDDKNATAKKSVQDFLKENAAWSPYVPALQAEQKGSMWVAQTTSTTTGAPVGESPLSKHIAEKNEAAKVAVNPLRPPAPTPPAAGS